MYPPPPGPAPGGAALLAEDGVVRERRGRAPDRSAPGREFVHFSCHRGLVGLASVGATYGAIRRARSSGAPGGPRGVGPPPLPFERCHVAGQMYHTCRAHRGVPSAFGTVPDLRRQCTCAGRRRRSSLGRAAWREIVSTRSRSMGGKGMHDEARTRTPSRRRSRSFSSSRWPPSPRPPSLTWGDIRLTGTFHPNPASSTSISRWRRLAPSPGTSWSSPPRAPCPSTAQSRRRPRARAPPDALVFTPMIWSIDDFTITTVATSITGADADAPSVDSTSICQGHGSIRRGLIPLGPFAFWRGFTARPYDIGNFHTPITGPIDLGIHASPMTITPSPEGGSTITYLLVGCWACSTATAFTAEIRRVPAVQSRLGRAGVVGATSAPLDGPRSDRVEPR